MIESLKLLLELAEKYRKNSIEFAKFSQDYLDLCSDYIDLGQVEEATEMLNKSRELLNKSRELKQLSDYYLNKVSSLIEEFKENAEVPDNCCNL